MLLLLNFTNPHTNTGNYKSNQYRALFPNLQINPKLISLAKSEFFSTVELNIKINIFYFRSKRPIERTLYNMYNMVVHYIKKEFLF